eukprot:754345-Hanusia_phi.AAC.3
MLFGLGPDTDAHADHTIQPSPSIDTKQSELSQPVVSQPVVSQQMVVDANTGVENSVGTVITTHANELDIETSASKQSSLAAGTKENQMAAPEAVSTGNQGPDLGAQVAGQHAGQALQDPTTQTFRREVQPDKDPTPPRDDREAEYANFVAMHGNNSTPSAVVQHPMTPSSAIQSSNLNNRFSATPLGMGTPMSNQTASDF